MFLYGSIALARTYLARRVQPGLSVVHVMLRLRGLEADQPDRRGGINPDSHKSSTAGTDIGLGHLLLTKAIGHGSLNHAGHLVGGGVRLSDQGPEGVADLAHLFSCGGKNIVE